MDALMRRLHPLGVLQHTFRWQVCAEGEVVDHNARASASEGSVSLPATSVVDLCQPPKS